MVATMKWVVFCSWLQLLSPEDLLHACELMEVLGLPMKWVHLCMCFCACACVFVFLFCCVLVTCVCVCFHYTPAMRQFLHVHVFGVCCVLTKCVLPWYSCTGWLGIKHQVTYYFHAWMFVYSVLLCACVPCYICSHVIIIGCVWI